MAIALLVFLIFCLESFCLGIFLTSDNILLIAEQSGSNSLIWITDSDNDVVKEVTELIYQFYVLSVTNVSKAEEVLREPLEEETTVFLDLKSVHFRNEVMSRSTIHNLVHATWIVMSQNLDQSIEESFEFAYQKSYRTRKKRLSLQSKLFYMEPSCSPGSDPTCDGSIGVHQILGNVNNNPTIRKCGQLGRDCDLSRAIMDTGQRLDFGGQEMKVSYELWSSGWNPMLFARSNGSLDGAMIRITRALQELMNLTFVLEPFRIRDNWSLQFPNGTWIGGLADVAYGIVETSIGGFVPTIERFEIADFTGPLSSSLRGILVQKPEESDGITVENYTQEFQGSAWLAIFLLYCFCWTILAFLLLTQRRQIKECMELSLAVTLRAFISKGTPLKIKPLSLKICILSLLGLSLIVFSNYKAIMNAFLFIKIVRLPINSMEDVLNSPLEVITYKGTYDEGFFRYAPKESIFHQIFVKKILNSPGAFDLGIDEVIHRVAKGEAIFAGALTPAMTSASYPCSVVYVKSLSFKTDLTMPFAKESPFYHSFELALSKLREHGELDRIQREFSLDYKEQIQCGSMKKSLDLTKAAFPFGCLILGTIMAVVTTVFEKLPWIARQRKRLSDEDCRRSILFQQLDQRKNSIPLKNLEDFLRANL